jgi:hypothetical protein
MRGWLVALVPLTLLASGSTVRGQEPRVSLSVKPMLCITDRREESCALLILVAWQSSRAGPYCLHSELATDPLRCWELAEAGMVVDERVVQTTFRYWLTNGASATPVAEATLDVMSADSDDRRRNRPRRHVWDIL